jgi:hypothetical protein
MFDRDIIKRWFLKNNKKSTIRILIIINLVTDWSVLMFLMEYWVIQLLTENILVRKNIKRHLNDQQDVILAILLKKNLNILPK